MVREYSVNHGTASSGWSLRGIILCCVQAPRMSPALTPVSHVQVLPLPDS